MYTETVLFLNDLHAYKQLSGKSKHKHCSSSDVEEHRVLSLLHQKQVDSEERCVSYAIRVTALHPALRQ